MRRDHSKALDSDTESDGSGDRSLEPTSAGSGGDEAIRRINFTNVVLTLLLGIVGCAADLISKQRMFDWLGPPGTTPPHLVVKDVLGFNFGFETSINTGGLFGMFSGNTTPLAIISCFAVGGVLWWLTLGGASRDRILAIILGLILGGILGNLYDRLGLWGIKGVRDWILCTYHQHIWPNFNIADVLLVCGAGLMMLHAFRAEMAEKRAAKAVAAETDS